MSKPTITTQAALREEFWKNTQHMKRYRGGKPMKQNDYPADVRMEWCEFIEGMERNNLITMELASRATL